MWSMYSISVLLSVLVLLVECLSVGRFDDFQVTSALQWSSNGSFSMLRSLPSTSLFKVTH